MWGVKKWLNGDLISDQTANSATLEWVLCNRGLPVLNFGATGNGEKEKNNKKKKQHPNIYSVPRMCVQYLLVLHCQHES